MFFKPKPQRGDDHHPHDTLMWRQLHSILHPVDDPCPNRTVVMRTIKNDAAGQPDTLLIMVTPAPQRGNYGR